jgi:hypothetical protein
LHLHKNIRLSNYLQMSFTRVFARRFGAVSPKFAFAKPAISVARANVRFMAIAAEKRAADATPITTIHEEPYTAFGST